jgi:hypothetical protein
VFGLVEEDAAKILLPEAFVDFDLTLDLNFFVADICIPGDISVFGKCPLEVGF